MQIALDSVSKTFGSGSGRKVAVDDVSWRAESGEVVGLLGPNGAGKTTMIRMLLDILRPDAGCVRIDGDDRGNRGPRFKERTGYLPEERGLYQRRKVSDVLWYLGALKGLSRAEALARGGALLARLELEGWERKRVNELSKGMGQKVQIACSVIHDPDLVVLDEPFSGLDPLNVRLVRRLVSDLRREGKVVLLSTHLMAEVEALCDRIFMIDGGKPVVEGTVRDIQRAHTPYDVMVDPEVATDDLDCIAEVHRDTAATYLRLAQGATMASLMAELGRRERAVRFLKEATTPIEEIFVRLVASQQQGAE